MSLLGPSTGPGLPGGRDPGDSRNLILAMVISMAVLFGFEFFWAGPQRVQQEAAMKAQAAAKAQTEQVQPGQAAPAAPAAPIAPKAAIAQDPRVVFDTPRIDGTINLTGARFDDLSMKEHRQKLAKDSPEVRLFSPQGAVHHFDAFFGWENGAENPEPVVSSNSQWTVAEGAKLTPATPITLTHDAGNGLTVTRVVSVDDHYVFTIEDTVSNAGAAPVALRPFAVVRRTGLPEDFVPNQIVHQGLLGVLGPELQLKESVYQKAKEHAAEKERGRKAPQERILFQRGEGGWLGVSDHYWLAALLPPQKTAAGPGETIDAWFDATPRSPACSTGGATKAVDCDFRAAYRGAVREIAPGASISYTQRLYAGAKEVNLLQRYMKELELPKFDNAVDWGFLWMLTRPFFWLLDHFGAWFGNFGLAIMATTVVVKIALFWFVNKSYESMAKLKKIQPQMKEIQERFAADKQRQSQEMIKLYQTEKVNPVSGCLPILIQIPIFYALYKVLTVTIEMRHAPFFGWIQDLSAKDPTSWVNLFGILPFDATPMTTIPLIGTVFAIGVFPILYGITMWGVQSLSPPPPDPVQATVFKVLPWIFVLLFAGFAAGLVIYWTWSNLLSIIQQYVIMRKNGVETEFDKLLARLRGKPAESGVVK
jgi:YidC/Oxa1 family membrane protein insertase